MRLSPQQYCERYLGSNLTIEIDSLVPIVDRFNLSLDSIIEGRVDFAAVSQHCLGNDIYIPERYTVGAYSRRRTMRYLLEYVETHLGIDERSRIMRQLQVPERALDLLDEKININFAVDLMKELAQRGAPTDFFRGMGSYSIRKTKNLPFAAELAASRTVMELYENYVEDKVKWLEKNSVYKYIAIDGESFIIEARNNEEVIDSLKDKKYGSRQACEYKIGVMTHIAEYAGFPAVRAEKLQCIHQGDECCRWIARFDKRLAVRRPSGRPIPLHAGRW
jgi:hypothetical protein